MMKCVLRIIALSVMIQVSPVLFAEELNSAIEKITSSLGEQLMKKSTKKLAVGNFIERTGFQSTLGDFISEELLTGFVSYKNGIFDVVERKEIDLILREQSKYTQPVFDKKTLVELQKISGIDVLVTGTISMVGKQIIIYARAIHVGTMKILASKKISIDRNPDIDNMMQRSSNFNLDTGVNTKQGRFQQSGNVHFKNELLHVISTGVVKGDEKNQIRITTKFHNITNEPLYISFPQHGQNSYGYVPFEAFASTELGDLFYISISGLRAIYNTYLYSYEGKERCSVITPNSFINVVWNLSLTNTSTSIKGTDLTIRSNFYNCKDDKPQQFTVQLSGIKLN